MKLTSKKRLAVGLLAAALPLSMAACSKGGSSSAAGSAGGELTMWTHNAGNKGELAAITQIVNDYNKSQTKYKVKIQAFPQDSYNQSVVAAAASKKLPCILDIDGPNVPNWAWAGYLAPLEGMDDTLSKFLPTVLGKYNSKTYSYGYYDVALVMVTRKTILDKYGIRVPTIEKPWTKDEFTAALKKVKASGSFKNPLDIATSFTGEWWPYAYSPMLQSFGGDLISRTDYKSAEGVLNGDKALEWATWFRGLVTDGLVPLKSGADPAKDFINGKTAVLYNGTWTAVDARKAFGKDTLFLPPPDLGTGPKIGGGSWQWGISTNCADNAGAMDYMKFAAQDKYVASVARDTNNIPATDAAAAMVKGYEKGGENQLFLEYAKKFAVLRPVTPGYPFIATEFTKTAQDILNGADPKKALDQAVKDIDANQKSNGYFQ
ncbi:MAG TPA: sugar ABC transporter substrate-binding protein [Intrasporangium sp.]|uniref:ABC transporter substrate-binding protein n=1 Tax=Intrasporangium sp. TaxID=1925024 RepID=UPI002D7A1E6F|nr:sugar ABC transporter substrate-binding protein [Intrasporangium sp.]HET7399578.1 sugar ABC transporter substrate-binding protein [Intrasporangium sp.]